MTKQATVSLVSLITEIALRCTAKVCVGFSAERVLTIAAPLGEALVDLVVGQSELDDDYRTFEVKAPNYHCFELWNRILDEIVKEIPVAKHINVTANVTRAQRANFIAGNWSNGSMTRREIAALHPDQDGNKA